MNNLSFSHLTFQPAKGTWREEMIKELVEGINKMREAENWQYVDKSGKTRKLKPITAKEVALRLNRNPFTKGNKKDGEVAFILKMCKENGYQQFFFRT